MRGSRRGGARDAEQGCGGHHSGRAHAAAPPDNAPPPSVRDRMAMAATALTGCRGGRVGSATLHFDDRLPARDDTVPGGAAAMPSGFSLHGYAHAGLLDGSRGRVDGSAERPRLYPAAAPQATGEPPASPRILFGGLRAQLRDLAAANAPHLLQAPGSWEEEDPLFLSAPWSEDSVDAMDDTAPAPPHDTARYAPLLRLEAPPVATLSAAARSEQGGPLAAADNLQQDLDATWPVGGAHAQAPRPRVAALPPQRGHGSLVDDLDVAFAVTP